ncbi:MAG: Asp-tRNA(Asn)/Glu-tRNA(Gln) amidotransferase subunit GatB [Hyphomonadaceae bacterium]
MTAELDVRAARKDQLIPGQKGDWEIIIGLEVHAQVKSKAKLFSGASAEYGGDPNAHVSLVDAAMPGMLPVINKFCVEQAIRTGLGLKAEINHFSRFDRKNYFYPDLPQGYQISQYQHPIVGEGEVEIEADDEAIIVRIERLHLEQDAGKSIHDLSPTETFVDLNRAGVALMEIVSRPDMRSSKEAGAYFNKLRSIVRALGTCDGNMEEGSMRADVNVSVRRAGTKEWGTRCEIKNVNSVRFMAQAIEFEARRQIDILEDGGKIDQETRLFDPDKGETRTMRSKEDAHDYRYFPDPDLLPLELDPKWIEEIRASLPELPDAKKKRFESAYGLSAYDAGVLSADTESADYFETVAKGRDAKLAANWVTQELFGALNKAGVELSASPVKAAQLGALVDLIKDGTINGKIAKDVFAKMMETGDDPGAIVEREGLRQVTDTGAIEKAIDDLMAANADKVADVQKNPKAFGWWVGQTMKATGGKANPAVVNEILKKKLGV